ncbi:hypothetical protein V6N12_010578 [Hibiscus sabdariffa]|uniref:Uncharacterized protein n=1 Tax=Hibiscus sabdariffa TaxID=183260 RepID=A0ABR2EKH9_9ROSI
MPSQLGLYSSSPPFFPGLGLMRLVRGMQRLFRGEVNLLGWNKSFSQGIGITVPKARTRDKPMIMVLDL